MPINYSVSYYNGSSWVALTGVQNINVRWGRQTITDAWSSNTATVVLKVPNYYATPIPLLVAGAQIRIKNLTSNQDITDMWLADVAVDYGIPYASSVGNADYITLSLEGGFARFSRAQGNGYVMAAGTMSYQLGEAAAQTGVTLGLDTSNSPDTLVAGTTVNGSWGDWLNTFLVTNGARLQDYNSNPNISFKYAIGTGVNFSDTANNSSNKAYNLLNFGSLANNYYTQINVTPQGLGTSTAQAGSAPYRALALSTFNASSSQALDLANFYLGALNTTTVQPISVTMLAEAQSVQNLDTNFLGRTQFTSTLTFRGTTRTVMTIGGVMSATPESMSMTCYLSGFDNFNFLELNDAVFGTLNYNKLGF